VGRQWLSDLEAGRGSEPLGTLTNWNLSDNYLESVARIVFE